MIKRLFFIFLCISNVLCIPTFAFAGIGEHDYQTSFKLLKLINALPAESNYEGVATRYDCLRILINIDRGIENIYNSDDSWKATRNDLKHDYADISDEDSAIPYLFFGELHSIFNGKLDADGKIVADLSGYITWREALLMSLRISYNGTDVFTQYAYDNPLQLIELAENKGLINQTLLSGNEFLLTEDIMDENVPFKCLCSLANRVLHVPIVVEGYLPYTKYLIDKYVGITTEK